MNPRTTTTGRPAGHAPRTEHASAHERARELQVAASIDTLGPA